MKWVLHGAYVPQEGAPKLRDALPNAIYAHQIKTQQLKGQNSHSRSRKPTEGISGGASNSEMLQKT